MQKKKERPEKSKVDCDLTMALMHDYGIVEAFYSLFGVTVVALGK